MEYNFYFDESFHDRNITKGSLKSNDFFNSYLSVGVGIKKYLLPKVEKRYEKIETKYKSKYQVNELKSEIVKKDHYINGLAKFNKIELEMYSEIFDFLIQNKILYYIFVCDKFEYLLDQCELDDSLSLNRNAVIYSITKFINTYRPENVILDILNCNENFLKDLKEFSQIQIKTNGDITLKEKENLFVRMIGAYLDKIDVSKICFGFDYRLTYEGLKRFQDEYQIEKINVIIDEEGANKICNCAKEVGYINAITYDSKESIGVRISDMLCGFISRMMRALYEDIKNDINYPYTEKHYLSKEWFDVDEKKYNLYKKIAKYFLLEESIYYSTYVNVYSDNFVLFIGLIYYFDLYKTYEKYKELDIEQHFKNGNIFLVKQINEQIKRIENNYIFENDFE